MALEKDRSYRLTGTQIEEFKRCGYSVLPGVFTREEMAGYRPFLHDYIMEKRQTMKEAGQAMEAGSTETFFNLAEATPAVADFVKLPRLGEIVARLLDVEAVRISHFSALFKPSGSPAIPLHQDHNFIPLNTNKTLAMWIPLTDIIPEMGALFFAEGSHLHGSLDPLAARERFHIVQGATNAGDISLHTAWTLHGSLRNSSEHMREAVGIHYYADGARIQMPMEAPLIQGILDPLIQTLLNRCFGGLSVGDLAAGPLNPVVYRRQDAAAADAQSTL